MAWIRRFLPAGRRKSKTPSEVRHQGRPKHNRTPVDPLEWAGFGLMLTAGVLAVYIAFRALTPGDGTADLADEARIRRIVEGREARQVQDAVWQMPPVHPPAFYQTALSQRDVFQLPWEAPVSGGPADARSSAEFSQQFHLVGILLDADPKAVLEEPGTQQTHFVSRGERLGNAFLQEITAEKAVFIYNGKRVELTP